MKGLWVVAKEGAAKQQHYVPQYYLRGFVNERKMLYVVDRPQAKFFRVPTIAAGGEKYFNLLTESRVNPFAAEEALQELEDKVAPALERVKGAQSLADKNDRSAIMNLMAAVTLRNPKERTAINEMVQGWGQANASAGLATKEGYEQMVAAAKAQGLQIDLSYEEMKVEAAKNPKWFKPPPPPQDFNIWVEAKFHDPLVQRYEQRKWQIVVASHDSNGFVTSDHPICLRWCDGKDHGFMSPGFSMPGTEVIFSLSPKLVVRGRFDGEDNVVQGDKDTVAGINSLLISNCNNQVYTLNALFSYKRGPKEEVGSGAHLDTDKVFLAGGREAKDGNVIALGSGLN
jgi:Protein of unknown function (DUF4238)